MFGFLKKGNNQENRSKDIVNKNLAAIADGKIIDITKVNDEVFSQKLLGESIAMQFDGSDVCLCAPIDGKLSVMFPTGHAFGISTNLGAEILVHIGINTVETNGKGFMPLKEQGETVKAGDPIVKVNFDELSNQYDMSTMLIVTNSTDYAVTFTAPSEVQKGSVIGTFL